MRKLYLLFIFFLFPVFLVLTGCASSTELSKIRNSVKALKITLANSNNRIEDIDSVTDELQQRMATLKAETDRKIRKVYDTIAQTKAESDSAIEKVNNEIRELKGKYDTSVTGQRLKDLNSNLSDANKKVLALQKEVKNLNDKKKEIDLMLEKIRTQYAELGTDTISASQFVVKDKEGKERAFLGLMDSDNNKFNGPALIMFDKNEKIRFFGCSTIEGTLLNFYEKSGKWRSVLGIYENGPYFNCFDKTGLRSRFAFYEGQPFVLLCDKAKQPRVAINLYEKGPRLSLSDKEGQTRLKLGYTSVTKHPINEQRSHTIQGVSHLFPFRSPSSVG